MFIVCYFHSSYLGTLEWAEGQLHRNNLPAAITQLNPVDLAGFEPKSLGLKADSIYYTNWATYFVRIISSIDNRNWI